MKEHGILMSAPMVRAYLAGLKSQTRRTRGLDVINADPNAWKFIGLKLREDGSLQALFERLIRTTLSETKWIKMPYGWRGDLLWFKETHALICKVADPYCWCETEKEIVQNHYVEYRADTTNRYPADWPEDEAKGNDEAPKWKPSIFMKRKYARIVTPVLNVRVERLHAITEEDAKAEGCIAWNDTVHGTTYIGEYSILWNKINEKVYPWSFNPWVWVYEFKPNEKKMVSSGTM